MRTCPKCLDYYADETLAFCLNDGTPLVGVDPSTDQWRQAARVLQEKEHALRRQQRKLKWRRVLLNSMTMLMATLVVFVIAVNGVIYLKPGQEQAGDADGPLTDVSANAPKVSIPQGKGGETSQTSVPAPETPVCSEADKLREREVIISSYGKSWRRRIEGEREKIIHDNTRDGVKGTKATLVSLEFDTAIFNSCRAATVTARHVWQLKSDINGTMKDSSVAKQKRFDCMKVAGAWLCR